VATVGGVGFPSLTALRRSDLLRDQTSVRVPSLAFIERCDRGPLPRKKGMLPIRAAADLCREIRTQFDRSGLRSTQHSSPRSQLSS
jgi:hypothetical protein